MILLETDQTMHTVLTETGTIVLPNLHFQNNIEISQMAQILILQGFFLPEPRPHTVKSVNVRTCAHHEEPRGVAEALPLSQRAVFPSSRRLSVNVYIT